MRTKSKPVTASTFSYEGLTGPVVRALKAAVPRIKQAVQQERSAAINVGRELLRAKAILKTRSEAFVPWVTKECGLNPRSANRYMAAARVFGDAAEQASKTPAQVIYGLSQAKKLSAPARKLVSRIKAGNVVSLSEYRNTIGSTPRKSTAANKPGASCREWWQNKPAAATVATHIGIREFRRFVQSVEAAYTRKAKLAA